MTLAEFTEIHLKSIEDKCGLDKTSELYATEPSAPKDERFEDGFASRVVSGMSRLRER